MKKFFEEPIVEVEKFVMENIMVQIDESNNEWTDEADMDGIIG